MIVRDAMIVREHCTLMEINFLPMCHSLEQDRSMERLEKSTELGYKIHNLTEFNFPSLEVNVVAVNRVRWQNFFLEVSCFLS